jgi:hypothetical protein
MQNWFITLVFEKNANFFAENWQKSQKIVIVTSTLDEFSPNGRLFSFGSYVLLFINEPCINFDNKWVWLHFGRFFYKLILSRWCHSTTASKSGYTLNF